MICKICKWRKCSIGRTVLLAKSSELIHMGWIFKIQNDVDQPIFWQGDNTPFTYFGTIITDHTRTEYSAIGIYDKRSKVNGALNSSGMICGCPPGGPTTPPYLFWVFNFVCWVVWMCRSPLSWFYEAEETTMRIFTNLVINYSILSTAELIDEDGVKLILAPFINIKRW